MFNSGKINIVHIFEESLYYNDFTSFYPFAVFERWVLIWVNYQDQKPTADIASFQYYLVAGWSRHVLEKSSFVQFCYAGVRFL